MTNPDKPDKDLKEDGVQEEMQFDYGKVTVNGKLLPLVMVGSLFTVDPEELKKHQLVSYKITYGVSKGKLMHQPIKMGPSKFNQIFPKGIKAKPWRAE